jgi:hypothetical protein
MKETQFGFEYSWADLQPVRALSVVVFGAQIVGAIAGIGFPQFPRWFESLWFGAAISTFPAFLLGLAVQSKLRPGSIGENKVMVRRLGLIALALSSFALAMPVLGVGK